MIKKFNNSWDDLLEAEFKKDYFVKLEKIIDEKYEASTCYPKYENIFLSFKMLPYERVKVVILGQDPYHEENQAMGLSFSVPKDAKMPPSLKNIFKELSSDLNIDYPSSGDLSSLVDEGVFLLNTTLTVEKGKALSHKGFGWERFTDTIISILNDSNSPICFILWGNNARSKKNLITNKIHLVLESEHPSPLSAYRGFFGSKPFSKTNEFLKKNNMKEINWGILK